jgi:predicted aminopeptidase
MNKSCHLLAAELLPRWRSGLLLCVLLSLAGCAQMNYYAQATHGQSSLMAAARPIDDLLQNPELEPKLRQRLLTANKIRRFAVDELALPDNGTYQNYADLQRPYALWNVVATPELSMKPLQWCFPIAGCVSYRGYYSEAGAQAFAGEMRAAGNDVQIMGVPAYSTLGWYKDPVLSSFINYPDAEVARLMIHELAHQIVYVQGDTQFNESFATAVEEVGVDRWLARNGDEKARQLYMTAQQRKQQFIALLLQYRQKLVDNYASGRTDAAKRQAKQEIFAALQDDYQALKASWNGHTAYDRWFAQGLTNAHLASVATYHDLVPGFRALLRETNDFPAFYRAVIDLSRLDKQARDRQLAGLAAGLPVVSHTDATVTGGGR